MRRLFIYYRIASRDAAAALPAAQALQARLREQHAGLQAELLRRPGDKDGLQTWMEIYTHPEGVSDAVEKSIEVAAGALSAWQQGPRHVEAFVPCAC